MPAVLLPDGRIDLIPLELIESWEQFQQFSADLIKLKANIVEAREYLSHGAPQDGIDVYASTSDSTKLTVIQCKNVNSLTPKKIEQIFSDFLAGDFVTETKTFIVCTNVALNKGSQEKELGIGRKKLKARGIDLLIWDSDGINRELRTNPTPEKIALVVRYFTHDVAESFYGDDYLAYRNRWRNVSKPHYDEYEGYVERKLVSQPDYYNRDTYSHLFSTSADSQTSLYEIVHRDNEKRGNKALVLSVGGFGKSVELQQLAGRCSKANEFSFPVLHQLKDYSGQSIEYILSLHEVEWNYIQADKLVLIFDGLDEIKPIFFDDFIRQLNLFADTKPKANIVVSSRFNFYEPKSETLRGFETFILEAFSQSDIDYYLDLKLKGRTDYFRKSLLESKLQEYLQNPFYLVRLVRLFQKDKAAFPKTKTAFFNRVLFERLSEEQRKYGIEENQSDLLDAIKQVAFCMTLRGESSIDQQSFSGIIGSRRQREKLLRYFLLNKNADEQERWSFEHKNLQEYLCALCFQHMPIATLLKLITFGDELRKVQPKYLNTLSFLFSLQDQGTTGALFCWLLDNEPDILMRFEKNRIAKESRTRILTCIIHKPVLPTATRVLPTAGRSILVEQSASTSLLPA